MQLSNCLNELNYTVQKGDLNHEITSIAFDSRKVTQGSLFVAIAGFATDGHQYIEKAIASGAQVILLEKETEVTADVTVIKVPDSRLALAGVSSNFYECPTSKLNLVGITGTNGKTSITYFIKALLENQNKKTGIIGTIGTLIGDRKIETPNTTPESLTLQEVIHEMVTEDVEYCLMEVSSHALELNRVGFCQFNAGIFTNLTPDHLELHKDMESYYQAKAKLFHMTQGVNIINLDDAYGRRLASEIQENSQVNQTRGTTILTYGLKHPSDVMATHIEYFADHSTYTAVTPIGNIEICVHVPGEIYIYNSLAVVAWAVSEGFTSDEITQGIAALKHIKGRFETVYEDESKKVVIDFAHTEDGLEKALDTLRPFTKNRLLLVFGVYAAPGALGIDKRLAMGKVAGAKADYSFVTSDNPKEQDPNAIIEDVVSAVKAVNGKYEAIVDRKEAIERALEFMMPGDVLLISGKGHETAQVVGKVEIPFNETEIVREKMNRINLKK